MDFYPLVASGPPCLPPSPSSRAVIGEIECQNSGVMKAVYVTKCKFRDWFLPLELEFLPSTLSLHQRLSTVVPQACLEHEYLAIQSGALTAFPWIVK